MLKKDIAIIVAAQNIPKQVIDRFKESVVKSNPSRSYDILIGSSQEKIFYKTRILNDLLRKNFEYYSVFIQTDIDVIVPPKIIDKTYEITNNARRTAYHHFLRYVDPKEIENKSYKKYPFQAWINLPAKFCSGCWNGMNGDVWRLSRGFNEEMSRWGYEDTEFFNRSRRLGIQWVKSKEYALVHINHEHRQANKVKENLDIGNRYSDQTDWLLGSKVLA